ncbi:MAG TPA: CNNM domain-containing protein, partial [Streptococcus parasuis]|nr:CNNM domain-containing protein [Streptococcus parasuis]
MEDPGSQTIYLQLSILFLLTLFNAFFSASEMALVSLNRSRVEQKAAEGEKKFVRLLTVLENPNNFLSTIQVGITFISILSGASLANDLGAVFAKWMGNSATAQTAGYWLALAMLTYVSIVLGELYPKRIAMNMKENLAVIT